MRIIGGKLGGQRLAASVPRGARPTSDRVREAIASVLQSRAAFDDARVLDLFAGSGALGLEALSWGARSLIAVDHHAGAIRAIRDNATALGVQDSVVVQRVDLLGDPAAAVTKIFPEGAPAVSLVFLDPPYAKAQQSGPLLDALVAHGALAPDAFAVVEHSSADAPQAPALLTKRGSYRYGDTAVALYSLSD